MKLRKFLLGGAAVLALSSFAFLSCSTDSEEDDELTVSIDLTYSSDKSSATVTMSPSETTYGDSSTSVFIAYTTDGSEPTVEVSSGASLTDASLSSASDLRSYVDYGSADIYEDALSFTETVTINAKAFYISGGKLYYGPLATKNVEITATSSSATSTDSDDNAYGNLEFGIASSGNSLSTHYFDTSKVGTFTYTDTTNNNATVANCYYQFQFSYKKNGSGNWFLYIRQVGTQSPIGNSTTGKKYLTSGTYTCDSGTDGVFNGRSSTSVNNGTFSMLDNANNSFASNVTMTDSSFTLKIGEDTVDESTGTVTTKGNLTTAIENAK